MNPLHRNLLYAFLSYALFFSLVSVARSDSSCIRQSVQLTAARLSSFSGLTCLRQDSIRIVPPAALKQIARALASITRD